MPIDTSLIITKIDATLEALETMTAKEREAHPSRAFAEDYDKVRTMALGAKPELAEVMPPVSTRNSIGTCAQRFIELRAWLKQIRDFLQTPGGYA
jgi:hypothetical protein